MNNQSIIHVFAVKDSKVGAYLQPFQQESPVQAERAFEQAANDVNTQIHKYPGDFELWMIASFDRNTGKFTNIENPTFISNAAAYIKPDNQLSMPLNAKD